MANLTSFSIDDQEERHFIGDLLSEEDLLEQPDDTHIDGSAASRLSTGGALSSSCPSIPCPNQTCGPEPPRSYNGCTVCPPQWSPMNHQPVASLIASPVATTFGQSLTAAAVVPTHFLEAAVNGPGEWRLFMSASMDGFLQVSPEILYPQHTGVHAGDALDMMRHYYSNVNHQRRHRCVVNTNCFTDASGVMWHAAVPRMIQGHTGMDRNQVLHAATLHTGRSAKEVLVREQN